VTVITARADALSEAAVFFDALAAISCVYTLFAALQVLRLAGAVKATPCLRNRHFVSVLKPLCSAEPRLYENLKTFCKQDYAGELEILFGVANPTDPAVAVVERLMHDIGSEPHRMLKLVVTGGVSTATNDKVANLVGIARAARGEIFIMSDSDIAVRADYVTQTVVALEQPDVGLVTWLYRGAPVGGLPARLARMAIDFHFLPSVLVGRALDLAHPCFGSTIALSRDTLARVGNFEAFGEYLADDYAIGDAVRELDLNVVLRDEVLAHACTETSLRELVQHELRWARTVRAVDPVGFAGSILTHPIPLALIAVAPMPFTGVSLILPFSAVVSRLVLRACVAHTLTVPRDALWLMLVRDLMCFVVFVASFFVTFVRWRGRRYLVRADGTLASVRENRA